MFQDTNRHPAFRGAFISDRSAPKAVPRKPKVAAAPAGRGRRQVNYRARSTPRTQAKHDLIGAILFATRDGLSVAEIGKAVGMSRQLALYHVKKMAAAYGLVMVLEPCLGNGGLQFRCWDATRLAEHYAGQMRRAA
jgi:hypothetical protein